MYCLSIIIVGTSDFKIKEFLLHWANEKIQHLMLLLSLNTLLVPEDKKEKKKSQLSSSCHSKLLAHMLAY